MMHFGNGGMENGILYFVRCITVPEMHHNKSLPVLVSASSSHLFRYLLPIEYIYVVNGIENATNGNGVAENDGPLKCPGMKLTDMKLKDMFQVSE